MSIPDSAFLIGIDLGTTNCAVAVVDTRARRPHVALFPIPQLVEPSVVASRAVLPSFLYFGEPHEIESGALATAWNRTPDAIAGVLARERGALAPARQVASAKSWLAHPGVDRRAAILPWGTTAAPRISPVDASARYLMHIRDAWNATIAAGDEDLRLERQRIVLTVPASFDEEARELTVEAARRAEFAHLTLLEEPIAAFYAWIADQRTRRSSRGSGVKPTRDAVRADDRVALVCDVGGGTSDFSLIRVGRDAGTPTFERFRSAITCCSAATTSTLPWRPCSNNESRRRAPISDSRSRSARPCAACAAPRRNGCSATTRRSGWRSPCLAPAAR